MGHGGGERAPAASLGAGLVALPNAGATTKHKTIPHVANARSQNPRPPVGPGGGPEFTVTSISATSLVANDPGGTSRTFVLTASTTFQRNGATASESDVAAGDRVVVTLAPPASSSSSPSSSSTSATAWVVDVVSPSLAGTVVSVSGSGTSLVIVVADGSGFYRTIDLSLSTTYQKDGSTAAESSITPGTLLSALGSVASDHTTDASAVTIGAPTLPTSGRSFGSGRGWSPGPNGRPPLGGRGGGSAA